MTPLAYIAHIQEPEPGEFLVSFPDVPEAITQGDTREEAIANAADALEAALETYLELGRDLPPSKLGLELLLDECAEVAIPPPLAARFLLARAMREQRLSKVELAARMHRDEKAVRRILGGDGASFELTLEALRAVGVRPALAS